MMSFRGTRLQESSLPLSIVWFLESLAEFKGRQQLYAEQSPQLLRSLREAALIESAESSNRIEGVTVEKARLRPLIIENVRPRDRSEEDLVGYRRALNWIHEDFQGIEITPETCRQLHALSQGGSGDAGQWKMRPNDIMEILPNGQRVVRFQPLAPERVPEAMGELCQGYEYALAQSFVPPLLPTACLILDFLCIHPFRDGNGRVSRLLTLLACLRLGYDVGRFISFERIVEQSKDEYYRALKDSSQGWQDGRHDILPWLTNFLSVCRRAYKEFEDRAQQLGTRRGTKSDLVEYALARMTGAFGIADVQLLAPGVSRDTVRLVMNRWRESGRLEMLGRGRDAKWRRTD